MSQDDQGEHIPEFTKEASLIAIDDLIKGECRRHQRNQS